MANFDFNPSNRHDPYAALRFRDFRLLLTGRFVTMFGSEMLSFAISWELWLRTHKAFSLGLVGLAQVLPIFLFSLPAGHDRYFESRGQGAWDNACRAIDRGGYRGICSCTSSAF